MPDDGRRAEGDHSAQARRDDGKLLPDSTSDDTDAGWGERESSNDERLRDERPPHWG